MKLGSPMKKNLFTLLFIEDQMRLNFVLGVVTVKQPVKICKQTRARYRGKYVEENNADNY